MSVHDPIQRKRSLPSPNHKVLKKMKSVDTVSPEEMFSEKMYSAYVKSALDSLDKVSILDWMGLDIRSEVE